MTTILNNVGIKAEKVRAPRELGEGAGHAGGMRDVYGRLKGVVLLGGAVRPTALSEGLQGSLLDLPLDGRNTLLERWYEQTCDLAKRRGIVRLPLMVMLNATTNAPGGWESEPNGSTLRREEGAVTLKVMRDPGEYRGTGGLLRDIAVHLENDDFLVVATGAQLLIEPLYELVHRLEVRGGDVGILGPQDGTPSGLMLVRCGVLREIAEVGFVDLKEQALPAIARNHRIMVERCETVSYPVRTTPDYLTALRQYHRRLRGERVVQDAFAEDWRSEFTVIQAGAHVDASARLFDSVVLSGGTVGPGAVLVRSVVCRGGVVKRGHRVVDELVAPSERQREVHTGGGVR